MITTNSSLLRGLAALAITTALAPIAYAQRSLDGLLLPLDPDANPEVRMRLDADPLADSPIVLRRRTVAIDEEALRTVALLPADELVGTRLGFELLPGVSVTAVVDQVETVAGGHLVVSGRLARLTASGFTLALSGDVVIATFHAPGLGTFHLRPLGEGVSIVREIAQDRLGDCACGEVEAPLPPEVEGDGGVAGGSNDSGAFIDVLVTFTANARIEQGGSAAMHAVIATAIAETNQAYGNSDITPRLRLVGMHETNFDDSDFTFSEALGHLANPTSGNLDVVHDWRDDAAADLVVLLVSDLIEDSDQFCGLAYIPSTTFTAFSVTRANCALGPGWTFGHEIGHNMGCNHDHGESAAAGTAPFAFGHSFTGNGTAYRTIMVRQSQPGTRVQHFSNPEVSFDGGITGIPAGMTNEADNARTHDERAGIVANFRQALPSEIWVDFEGCIPPFQFGTFSNPYCALPAAISNVIWNGVIKLKPGLSGTTPSITIEKAMTLQATNGPVTIGQ